MGTCSYLHQFPIQTATTMVPINIVQYKKFLQIIFFKIIVFIIFLFLQATYYIILALI